MAERRLGPEAVARYLALFIAALVFGITVRYNTFAAWATDSGAYLSAGYAWADSDLFSPATFVNWAPWAADGHAEFPLGHVQGPIKGTITGQYPLGYPLLIAAALKFSDSPLTPHVVSPLLGALMAWCAFLLGQRMTSAWAGVFAALMIGATPIALAHTVIPFSDVPATAFWALAWLMSVRSGHGAALASGAAAAMAVTIRPNLAPLALVIAATVCFSERGTWRHAATRLVAFGLTGIIGPLIVMWSQAALYGHPLQSGYRVPMDFFFSAERIPTNAALYPGLLAELHTWLAFGGLLYVPFAVTGMRTSEEARVRGLLALSAVGLIVVNYGLYLPYLTYEGWYWLRFLLPAVLAMFLLLAAGLDALRLWLQRRWSTRVPIAAVAFVPALVVVWTALEHVQEPVGYERIHATERYLAEVLPAEAVILTFSHGGAWARATKRPIVRLDFIQPDALDRVIVDLRRRGYRPVFVLDTAVEGDLFTERFRNQRYSRFTWPARAEIVSATSVFYYDTADRELFYSGDRWHTDVLVAGGRARAPIAWSDMRVEHERVILPLPEETAALRSALNAVYRDRLGRGAEVPAVAASESLRWMRRYLRLRLHLCAHETAVAAIGEQLRGGEPPPLCGRPDGVLFPPENETMAFRQAVEEQLRQRPARKPPTPVDALGEVVWTQRYVDARVRGCSHAAAIQNVAQQISGETVSGCD